MTGKIFKAVISSSILVLLVSIALSSIFLWRGFENAEVESMTSEMMLARAGVERNGVEYLESVGYSDCRFTLVDDSGKVLFDSDVRPSSMENHSEREEIQEALLYGYGRGERISSTLTVKTLYYAERLSDGSVLRIAVETATVWKMLYRLIEPLMIVLVLAVCISLCMARFLSRRIAGPLNDLDLEHPLDNNSYDELSPLLLRIHQQNVRIDEQVEDLERRQEEFSTVIESMNEALVLLDSNGNVMSMNNAAMALFDCSSSDIGSAFLSIERDYDIANAIEDAKKKGKSQLKVERNGLVWQLDISKSDTDEGNSGMVILAFDVTEESRAENLRREFTANVSHEMKTPLQSIMGAAELIENGLVKNEDIMKFTGRMRKEASRLVTLINDTIRLSKMDEGQTFQQESIDLRKIAVEVVDALSGFAAKCGIDVSVEGHAVEFLGSHQLVYDIIYNLVDNAIKYGKAGGHVAVSIYNELNEAVLKVADDGIGIPQKDQSRVFERFYRVDKSHSRDSGGTGLGLSIVKHSALLQGASIELDSIEGKGTEISVKFPMK